MQPALVWLLCLSKPGLARSCLVARLSSSAVTSSLPWWAYLHLLCFGNGSGNRFGDGGVRFGGVSLDPARGTPVRAVSLQIHVGATTDELSRWTPSRPGAPPRQGREDQARGARPRQRRQPQAPRLRSELLHRPHPHLWVLEQRHRPRPRLEAFELERWGRATGCGWLPGCGPGSSTDRTRTFRSSSGVTGLDHGWRRWARAVGENGGMHCGLGSSTDRTHWKPKFGFG